MEGAGFLAAALAMNTLAPVMTKITQNEQGGYSYNKWCVYFFAELIKLAVAGAWSLHLKSTGAHTANSLDPCGRHRATHRRRAPPTLVQTPPLRVR